MDSTDLLSVGSPPVTDTIFMPFFFHFIDMLVDLIFGEKYLPLPGITTFASQIAEVIDVPNHRLHMLL